MGQLGKPSHIAHICKSHMATHRPKFAKECNCPTHKLTVMNRLPNYYKILQQQIAQYLDKEYNSFKPVNFEQFDKVNFYLIDIALYQKKNIHIKTIQKDEKSNFYVPIVLSTALSLFYKNYCSTDIVHNVGDVLQRAGRRYKIVKFENGIYQLKSTIQGAKTITECKEKFIKKYDIVKGKLSNRRVKTRLDTYKELFADIFNTEEFPTNFKHKAAIILEWNDFQSELKEQNCVNLDLLKAIPIQRIKKNGESYNCSLPIDPMIYIIPDYYTFHDFVKDNYEIDSVILIGKNKYRSEFFEKLEMDLEYEEIPNAIIVGNESLQDNTQTFLKWNWTQPELSFLKNEPIAKINTRLVDDEKFLTAIDDLYSFLSTFETKYFTDLSNLKKFKRMLLGLTLPSQNSRLTNFKDWVQDLMVKEIEHSVKDTLISQNENYLETVEEINKLISNIFLSFSNSKLDILMSISEFDIIIVPKKHFDIWEKDYARKSIKFYTINQFEKEQHKFKKRKEIALLSLFGYELYPPDLIEYLNCFPNNYTILCYTQEETAVQEVTNRIHNKQNSEYSSIDRKELTGIDFKYPNKPENISDLIENIAERAEKDTKHYSYESQENINYALTFEENNEELVFDGSKSVLLHNENRKEQIFNLMVGDKVRIYANLSKEKLYEIALSEDGEGRFNEIDKYSTLWKDSLRNFFMNKQLSCINYSETDLLKELQHKGLKIKSTATICNWLYKERDKFPSSENSLYAVKQLINDDNLNINFRQVVESRRVYRGIMLSLGRNLSDEVMDYIISSKRKKGKMLSTFSDSEIQLFLSESLPLLTIKSKCKSEEDETN